MELTRELLNVILDTIGCGIFAVDDKLRVTFWNKAAERLTGIAAAGVLGVHFGETGIAGAFEELRMEEGTCRLFRAGEIKNEECVIVRPDGSRVRVLKNGRALSGRDGRVLGAVESFSELAVPKPVLSAQDLLQEEPEEAMPVPGMIGAGEAMGRVYRLVRFAADSESSVLITGESGTGKELVAKAVHSLSRRSGGPFVAVSCSALPESLLESELFGHVKGAFSGAIANKVGRFELAGGGTIFLDEIGDISPLIQLKLLRVVQEQEYQRVGESHTRHADVRVITATNKDLFQLVRKGEFREDLYFRLKVFPIPLPPLRERKSDIPALLAHFIEEFNRRTGKKVQRIHPQAMQLLLEYCWPGNVRELEHAVEYAFVLCQGEEIGPFELPQEILRWEFRRQVCPQDSQPGTPAAGERTRPEREALLEALEQAGWNQTRAARLLGISRVTVWSRMKKYGIARPGAEG